MSTEQIVKFAIAETGTRVHYTEEQVDAALKSLALLGGNLTETVEVLKESGVMSITRQQLKTWRDRMFPRRFAEIRQKCGLQIDEDAAGRLMERVREAEEAQQAYVEEAVRKVHKVSPDHLAKNALALAQVSGVAIEKARLLRDRPTEIREIRSPEAMLADLERLGIVKKAETIDGEAEEIE